MHPPPMKSVHSHLQYELLKLRLFLLNSFQPPLSLHLQLKEGKTKRIIRRKARRPLDEL